MKQLSCGVQRTLNEATFQHELWTYLSQPVRGGVGSPPTAESGRPPLKLTMTSRSTTSYLAKWVTIKVLIPNLFLPHWMCLPYTWTVLRMSSRPETYIYQSSQIKPKKWAIRQKIDSRCQLCQANPSQAWRLLSFSKIVLIPSSNHRSQQYS